MMDGWLLRIDHDTADASEVGSTASGFHRKIHPIPTMSYDEFSRRWMRMKTGKKKKQVIHHHFLQLESQTWERKLPPKEIRFFWLFFAVCRVFTRKTPPKEKTSNKTSPMFKCVFFFEKWHSLKCYSTPELLVVDSSRIPCFIEKKQTRSSKPSSFHLSSARSKWCSPLT